MVLSNRQLVPGCRVPHSDKTDPIRCGNQFPVRVPSDDEATSRVDPRRTVNKRIFRSTSKTCTQPAYCSVPLVVRKTQWQLDQAVGPDLGLRQLLYSISFLHFQLEHFFGQSSDRSAVAFAGRVRGDIEEFGHFSVGELFYVPQQ